MNQKISNDILNKLYYKEHNYDSVNAIVVKLTGYENPKTLLIANSGNWNSINKQSHFLLYS
jgi:hypothetical protein